jgi:hypothetical protein
MTFSVDQNPRIHASDPDPAIFVLDLQDAKKTNFEKGFFAYYFLKVHLHVHHFSKIKSQREVAK